MVLKGCFRDVQHSRTILSALILALALALVLSTGVASASESSALVPGYSYDVTPKSCDGSVPPHEHGHHCHNQARLQPASSLRAKIKQPLDLCLNVFCSFTLDDQYGGAGEIAITRRLYSPLGAKTPFRAVFRYTTSLLF